jgi:hypothetical protein
MAQRRTEKPPPPPPPTYHMQGTCLRFPTDRLFFFFFFFPRLIIAMKNKSAHTEKT